jgi:predicted DNA-binding protein
MTQLSERYSFKVSYEQKRTLKLLHSKYKINTAQFIRNAINEKLNHEKDSIFKKYKEVHDYLNVLNDCPF